MSDVALPPVAPTWLGRRRKAFADLAPFLGLVVLPLVLWTWGYVLLFRRDHVAYDFHEFFYPQARDLLAGRTPATAYPPLATLLYAPLALLPRMPADIAATLVMVAAAIGVLRILGVRDWRCYAAMTLWEPISCAVQTANLTLLLALGVAAMWRWRDHRLVAAGSVAAVVALKLFLWPLAPWLWVTGRRHAVMVMGLAGVVVSAAAWALVGIAGVRHFPELLRGNVLDNGNKPYTLTALARELGAGTVAAYAIAWTSGLATLAVGLRVAARGQEAAGLSLTIASALILSPIVWTHYLSLLLVPMALARPRFGPMWLAPLPLWLVPPVGGSVQSKLLLIACAAAIFTYLALAWDAPRWGRRATITS